MCRHQRYCWVVETIFMHCRTIFSCTMLQRTLPICIQNMGVFQDYLWMPRSSFKTLKQVIFLPLLLSSPECELTHTSALLNLHFWSTWMRCQSKTKIREHSGTVLSTVINVNVVWYWSESVPPILPRLVISPTDSSPSSTTYYWWLPNLPAWRCQHVLLQVWMHINALIVKL